MLVENEEASLGDHRHMLAVGEATPPVESDLFDFRHQLLRAAFAFNDDLAIGHSDDRPVGRECAADHNAASTRRYVDEPTRTHRPPAEPANVDVARGVRLGEAEKGHVQTAPSVEVERVG